MGVMMATSVKLSEELVANAKQYGRIYNRSVPKQIEYWSKIGKIAEENPDLSYNFIKDILLGQKELKDYDVTPYQFG